MTKTRAENKINNTRTKINHKPEPQQLNTEILNWVNLNLETVTSFRLALDHMVVLLSGFRLVSVAKSGECMLTYMLDQVHINWF